MFSHTLQIRTRYAETDQMGYVYYGNYATYYEVARVEAMRAVGFSYKGMEDEGVMMPVLELKCQFKNPAFYDELINIKVTIPSMPAVRIVFIYEVTGEDGRLLNLGETTLAFINKKSGKPVRMPEELVTLLSPYFKS
jgi:acyl-CoA thioester hydrolase